MDVKPDPKPGRWILPLVIVAMVGFTYVFVNSIEIGDGADGGDGGIDIESPSTTSFPVIDTTEPDDGGEELDPETQAYVDSVNGFDETLGTINTDFVAANDAWDDKTATYVETVDAFNVGIAALDAWAAEVAASTAPDRLTDLHQAVIDASPVPVTHAREALGWLESTESGTGAKRQAAVAEMQTAVAAFSDAVGAAVAAASG